MAFKLHLPAIYIQEIMGEDERDTLKLGRFYLRSAWLLRELSETAVRKIVKEEQLIIDPEVEDFILIMCNNSIRLLINYTEKFKILNERITLSIAKNICTNISYYELEQFTEYILDKKELDKAIDLLYKIFNKGS